jgi:orotidine-5'-phosphate decarboxylase
MSSATLLLESPEAMPSQRASDRLIVALDLDNVNAARAMVQELDGLVDFFKVGLVLQLAEGTEEFIAELVRCKKRVFLDYKYYDIPETVRKAVDRASKIGVEFLTIHGSSGVMKEAVRGRSGKLKLFTVTVLTSMDASDISEMGYSASIEELVLYRAKKALEAGCDGVIASGHEAAQIKKLYGNLLVVTPGIRQDGSIEDDQKRRMTPRKAIEDGADYLVLGRPITMPNDKTPREAAKEILAEMQSALDDLPVR